MNLPAEALHFNFDDAWPASALGLPTRDLRNWGAHLRFSAPSRLIEKFSAEISSQLPRFLLFGSGDFHHLSALWPRRLRQPFVLVSFDNHPDWDLRPPRWACGGWVNRALELPHVQTVQIWGCGNFECWWPHQLFGNRRAERAGRLAVHPWADDLPAKKQARRGAISRANWREHFANFADNVRGAKVYVTIDLDCLRPNESITNWENGKFSGDDLVWALRELHRCAEIVGGDLCGAYSPPIFSRAKQKFAATWDHPKLPAIDLPEAQRINLAALEKIWPALTQRDEHETGGNEQRTEREPQR